MRGIYRGQLEEGIRVAERKHLTHAFRLEVFTVVWNVIEAGVAVGAGIAYGSTALVAFGFDSMIEVAAAVILAWRLLAEIKGDADSEEKIERIERKAAFWVGVTFFLLAAYVLYESVEALISGMRPHPGMVGVALAAVSAAVMPVLWRMKLKAAGRVGSAAMKAEAEETVICAYLSFILLAGLLLEKFFGLWWADSAAALFMLYFIVREGWEAIEESRGKKCGCGCGH